MNRVDSLPDNQFMKRITDLQKQLAELGSYQRLGSHSTLSGRLFSANAYDAQATSIPNGVTKTVLVTFTPSSTLLDNLSLVHRLMYTYTSSSSTFLAMERLLPANNQQTWKIYIYNLSGSTIAWVQVKLYFFVIGSGTFTATVL